MKEQLVRFSRAALVAGGFAVCSALAQPPAKRDFDAEAQAAVQSAKTAAGFEFLGTLVRTCLLPQSGGEDTSDVVPPFVAGKIHSSWALTTKDGIILFDTLFPYNSEELIVGGMKKLGLDPKNIKYLLVSHAHSDHIGGAEVLQSRYGARIVM